MAWGRWRCREPTPRDDTGPSKPLTALRSLDVALLLLRSCALPATPTTSVSFARRRPPAPRRLVDSRRDDEPWPLLPVILSAPSGFAVRGLRVSEEIPMRGTRAASRRPPPRPPPPRRRLSRRRGCAARPVSGRGTRSAPPPSPALRARSARARPTSVGRGVACFAASRLGARDEVGVASLARSSATWESRAVVCSATTTAPIPSPRGHGLGLGLGLGPRLKFALTLGLPLGLGLGLVRELGLGLGPPARAWASARGLRLVREVATLAFARARASPSRPRSSPAYGHDAPPPHRLPTAATMVPLRATASAPSERRARPTSPTRPPITPLAPVPRPRKRAIASAPQASESERTAGAPTRRQPVRRPGRAVRRR